MKQGLPLPLDVLPKELPLQERPLSGQLLPLPRPLVWELPKEPLADAHPPGKLPLPPPGPMQRGVVAAKLRRPRHPDVGRQRPLLLRQLHDRLHKLVQQREHERHLLLQLGPDQDGPLRKPLEKEQFQAHEAAALERPRHPERPSEVQAPNPLPRLPPPPVLALDLEERNVRQREQSKPPRHHQREPLRTMGKDVERQPL